MTAGLLQGADASETIEDIHLRALLRSAEAAMA
jgi:hypothetical protein